MSRVDILNSALADLQASSSDIEACAVVSADGLIIASALPKGIEEERIGAMSAAVLAIGERIVLELNRGNLEQLYVKGSGGYFLSTYAGSHAVLIAQVRENAKLGLIFFGLNRAAETIKKTLG